MNSIIATEQKKQIMTKSERITSLAKEMQANCHLVVNSHNLTSIFIPAATLAIQEMARIYHKGYMSNFPWASEGAVELWEENCKEEMKELGLID